MLPFRRLRKVYVEITNVCNLSCTFCPPPKRRPQFMEPADFDRYIAQLEGWTTLLFFHLKGEPTLHSQLDVLLEMAGRRGFQVNLTTNGTRLARWADVLCSSPALRQVNLSLHNLAERGGGTDGWWQEAADFLARPDRPLVSLRAWDLSAGNLTPDTRGLLDRLKLLFPHETRWDELGPGRRSLDLAPKVWLNLDNRFVWPDAEPEGGGSKVFCHALRDQAGILSDGTVVPCCLDGNGAMALGHLSQTDFGTILAGERATALYDGFSQGRAVEKLCQRCNFRV